MRQWRIVPVLFEKCHVGYQVIVIEFYEHTTLFPFLIALMNSYHYEDSSKHIGHCCCVNHFVTNYLEDSTRTQSRISHTCIFVKSSFMSALFIFRPRILFLQYPMLLSYPFLEYILSSDYLDLPPGILANNLQRNNKDES